MEGPEEALKEAEERFNSLVERAKNETIYSLDESRNVKGTLVKYVDKDSKYKKSFDEYLKGIAKSIADDFDDDMLQLNDTEFLNLVVYTYCDLGFDEEPIIITLKGSDLNTITALVKKNIQKRLNRE